jgi:hypothetical protein
MCDYSLHGLPNRLAREGEELVAHRFCTGAIGLTAPDELGPQMNRKSGKKNLWNAIKEALLPPAIPEIPAVCIPPGATLRMMGIPMSLQRELGVGPDETVVFTQTTATAQTYHDAVRFANGRQILLQFLKEGQRVRVLSFGGQEPEYAGERMGAESISHAYPGNF